MASTEQVRKWFHSGVVLNHALRGTAGYTPKCNHNQPKVAFPNDTGGVYNEPVHPLTVEAFRAYVMVMAHHGETMPSGGGVDSCRNIAGSAWPSLHAYLCAVDLPPNSRKSNAFIASVEAIRTKSGAQAFTNLWFDRMHDQINCSPADLATGIDWSTVKGYDPKDDDMTLPLQAGDGYGSTPNEAWALPNGGAGFPAGTDRSHKAEDVRAFQDRLNKLPGADISLDGLYGPNTIARARAVGGSWTGNSQGKIGRWWGGNQDGELDWTLALEAAKGGGFDPDAYAPKVHDHEVTGTAT